MDVQEVTQEKPMEITINEFIELVKKSTPRRTRFHEVLTVQYIVDRLNEGYITVVYPEEIKLVEYEVLHLVSRLPNNLLLPITIGVLIHFNGSVDTMQQMALQVHV